MSTFIAIEGIEAVDAGFKNLPDAVQDAAVDEINPYLVNVLKIYPPYKYVPFATAYGGFFSEKQRKFVMASIREGTITPGQSSRTQTFARNWKIIGSGKDSIIANETPYGPFLMGDNEQARMPVMIGWKSLQNVIEQRADRINEKADAGAKKAIRKLGL